jgi:membrane fusion protein, multidrug efflux system
MNEHPPSTVEHGQPAPPVIKPGKPHEAGPDEQRPRRRRVWLWLLILIVAGVGVYYYISRSKQQQQPTTTAITTQTPGMPGHGRGGGIPPVVAVKAFKGNIGVYYTGLGAVTPIFTVTVKSRVDGQLMQVFYKEGQMVKEGDPLVEIDPRPYQASLTQYEGALVRDQASLANARVDLARYEQLIGRKAVPEQTLATQRALVAQDEGTVKTDQGQIEAASLNLIYCHITAPISGRLGLRLVDPGNYVQAASSTALAVITQIDPISVIFTLSEDQLGQVAQKFGKGARLSVDAYDREMNKKIASGALSTIDNQIDQTTGTVKFRATFDNPGGKLFPNQFVNAKLLVEEKRGVLLLQNAAIQRNSRSTYVFLVKPDQTVTIKQLQVGTSDGENTEITSGLEAGDVVVMTGVDKLQEGSKVQVHMEDEQSPAQGQDATQPAGVGQ